MKVCRICKAQKNIDQFYRSPTTRDKRESLCKECKEQIRRERRQTDRNYQRREANAWMRWKYGITLDEYERFLSEQDGVCAICKTVSSRSGRLGKLVVDHDHNTGRIRGLLCQDCNLGIGRFGDVPDVLRAAATYLEAAIEEALAD